MNELFKSQFFAGGFLLMLSGAVMALLRDTPIKVLDWFKSQFTVSLVVLDSDPLFDCLIAWLDAQPYSKKTRRLAVSTSHDDEEEKGDGRVLFSPAPGEHMMRHKGRFVSIHRDRSKPEGGGRSARPIESITLTIIGRSQLALREIVGDALEVLQQQQRERVAVYVGDYGWWRKLKGTRKRPYGSVFLPKGDADLLISDVQWFLGNRDSYLSASVPYRRGYLLHGLPGTGKTSIVAALASDLNLSLYVLPLSSPSMSDHDLSTLMLGVRPGSVVLLEDVDAVRLRRDGDVKSKGPTVISHTPTGTPDGDSDSGVTLSGLLNCLDGIVAQEGCMTFMTTNHIGMLDPALIRPGRVDLRVEFKHADDFQIISAYTRFFPNANGDATEFARLFDGRDVVMADVQEELMRRKFRSKASI